MFDAWHEFCDVSIVRDQLKKNLKFWDDMDNKGLTTIEVSVEYLFLRVLPTVEILNIRQKYEIKACRRGRSFLSVLGRAKRTSVPGLSTRELLFLMSG